MIDTHCHLTEERLMLDLDKILARARENGVEKIIVPGTSLEDSMKVVRLTERHDEVFGVVGIHPESILEKRSPRKGDHDLDSARDDIREMIEGSKKIVGVGEIGMEDYEKTMVGKVTKYQSNMQQQAELFKMQLELAVEMGKPVVIHNREADKEIMEVLDSMPIVPRGQFHCWAGDEGMLAWALDKGFYISFCGNITYKSAGNLREMIKKVPLERLLLETDAPYLSPEPKRGTLNEPANVKITAEYIANLLDVSLLELDRITTQNAKCLFFDI
jgi:TatD DNase family protein